MYLLTPFIHCMLTNHICHDLYSKKLFYRISGRTASGPTALTLPQAI